MSSSSREVLANEIIKLNIEIRSEKQQIRQKAIERLDHLLTSRTEEVTSYLPKNKNVSWEDLFESCYNGLLLVCIVII